MHDHAPEAESQQMLVHLLESPVRPALRHDVEHEILKPLQILARRVLPVVLRALDRPLPRLQVKPLQRGVHQVHQESSRALAQSLRGRRVYHLAVVERLADVCHLVNFRVDPPLPKRVDVLGDLVEFPLDGIELRHHRAHRVLSPLTNDVSARHHLAYSPIVPLAALVEAFSLAVNVA